MTKELWINLPVKDINRSKEFFSKLGFSFNNKYAGEDSVGLMIGSKNIIVMLFKVAAFEKFTGNKISDTKLGAEVLLSFDAESKEEVDEMASKAEAGGANIFSKPTEIQGWMYG
nr:extradiol dioxygenase [Bacteroidota bacterium]